MAKGNQPRYYAYGCKRTASANGLPTDYTFTGQRQDNTGLIYMNARYYDPEVGQFISPDTLTPDASNVFDYNRYMYTRGNPLKHNDPSGHCVDGVSTLVCFAVAGAVINTGMYLWNEAHQDGIDLSVISWKDGLHVQIGDDWGGLLASAGSGAASGALIATPVGAEFGIGMASNLFADHIGNALTGEHFSVEKHLFQGAIGGLNGMMTAGIGEVVSSKITGGLLNDAVTTVVKGIAGGAVDTLGNYDYSLISGKNDWTLGTAATDMASNVFGNAFGHVIGNAGGQWGDEAWGLTAKEGERLWNTFTWLGYKYMETPVKTWLAQMQESPEGQ